MSVDVPLCGIVSMRNFKPLQTRIDKKVGYRLVRNIHRVVSLWKK